MKHKEMLIAGNWDKQTFDLVPAQQFNISEKMGQDFFGELIEKISEINPNLTFEFNRWPCLTIKNGEETVAVLAHPAREQRHEHLKKFGCSAALFNGAFYNNAILEDVKQILPLFNVDFKDIKAREDLGQKSEIVNHSVNSLVKGAFDHVHFAELRSLYLKPSTLAENFLKVNGYEKGWIDGERDRDISEEFINLMKENPSFFRFSSKQDAELDAKLDEAMRVLDENVAEQDKQNLMNANEAQKLIDEHKAKLAAEREFVEQKMKELDLYWHPKRGNPYDKDKEKECVICNKYGRALVTYKKLSGDINIHASGMHNEAALAFSAAMAYERFGHDKVHWNVSKTFRKHAGSAEELALIADRTLDALIKAGFEPNQVVFPKDLQYLVQRKVDELMNNATFDQATPEQASEAKAVMDELAAKAKAENAAAGLDPVQEETIPDEAPINAPVKGVGGAEPDPAVPPAGPVPAAGDGVGEPVTKAPVAKKAVHVVNGCFLVKNHETDTYLLYGIKGKAPENMQAKTMNKVINKLAENLNPENPKEIIQAIKGCWTIDKPLYTLGEIKKHEDAILNSYEGSKKEQAAKFKEEYNYKSAYQTLNSLKLEMDAPKPSSDSAPTENTNIAGFEVDETVDSDVPEYESVEQAEQHVADVLNRPDVLDSEEYSNLKKARNEAQAKVDEPKIENASTAGSSTKAVDGLDDSEALADIEKAMKEKQQKTIDDLNNAMANKTNKLEKEKI